MLTNKWHPVPLLKPADITETATASQFLNIVGTNWVSLVIDLGTVTGATGTITLEQCPIGTTTDSSETAIGYYYRVTEGPATEGLGALTAVGSTGMVFAATDDDHLIVIEFDPATVTAGSKFLRAVITPDTSGMSACVVGVQAYVDYINKPSTAST